MFDTLLGILGIGATMWAAVDARRLRSQRERAVVSANKVIARSEGLLIGLKPSVPATNGALIKAIDDGLDAIKLQREAIAEL